MFWNYAYGDMSVFSEQMRRTHILLKAPVDSMDVLRLWNKWI